MCRIMVKTRKHFDFDEIEECLRNKTYPSTIPSQDYGSKSNFRRATKRYEMKDGHLFYKIGYQRQKTPNGNCQRRAPRYWRFLKLQDNGLT